MKDKIFLKVVWIVAILSMVKISHAQTDELRLYRSIGVNERTKEYIEISTKGDNMEYVVYGIDDSSYSHIVFYKYSFSKNRKYRTGRIEEVQFSYTKYRSDLFKNITNIKIFCQDWVESKNWIADVEFGPFVMNPWNENQNEYKEYNENYMSIGWRNLNDGRSNFFFSTKLYKLIEDK